jgi:hypothetical protein
VGIAGNVQTCGRPRTRDVDRVFDESPSDAALPEVRFHEQRIQFDKASGIPARSRNIPGAISRLGNGSVRRFSQSAAVLLAQCRRVDVTRSEEVNVWRWLSV